LLLFLALCFTPFGFKEVILGLIHNILFAQVVSGGIKCLCGGMKWVNAFSGKNAYQIKFFLKNLI